MFLRRWLGCVALLMPLTACGQRPGIVQGRVLDLQGRPIQGVQVRHGTAVSSSGPDGHFVVRDWAAPAWIHLTRQGYLPALRAAPSGGSLLVRLSADDGQTVVLHAVGDVMAGRRFFTGDPNTNQPPQLLPDDDIAAHQQLLAAMQPLLGQADITLANLESPLLLDPVAQRTGFRVAGFHSTKDYVFASSPSLAAGLAMSGMDVLGLANDHLNDRLTHGLRSTVSTLQLAGFRPGEGFFGAGETPEQAWQPARQRAKGATLSLLGCTTIHGAQHPTSYVASRWQRKGGAALCELSRLRAAVEQSRRDGPVVVMLHGGNEYQSEPTPPMRLMTEAALQAGARLVLNHHPHVLGGLRWNGQSLVAASLGNFLFDQTLWPTFPSMLLEVHLRRGTVQRVVVYPLLLHRYRPHLATGALADWILRGIAAKGSAPSVMEGGVMELDLAGRAQHLKRWWPLRLAGHRSGLWSFRAAVDLCGWQGRGGPELGRSLLGTGSFEDQLVGAAPSTGALWSLNHQDQQLDSQAARSGSLGVRLKRAGFHQQPVLLKPLHRIPVQPAQRLSLLAWVRGSAGAQARVQLSWYGGKRGPSIARLTQPISLSRPDRWQPVRIDVTVPDHVNAMAPAIALDPPQSGLQRLDVDDLDLVAWHAAGTEHQQPADWLRSREGGRLCLRESLFPGASRTPRPLLPWP